MTEPSPLDTKAQDRALRDKAERDQALALQERDDWQAVLSTESGRRVIRELLDTCGVYRSSFTGNSETFFREGERNVGLRIQAKVFQHAPEHGLVMLKEASANG